MPYYRVTRFLHALIACGITLQMLVSLLMVYPRPGRLPNAWWEVHEIAGLLLVAALGLHWAWSIGRTAVSASSSGARPRSAISVCHLKTS